MLEGVGHGDEEGLLEGGVELGVVLVEAIVALGEQGEGADNLVFDDEWHAHDGRVGLAETFQETPADGVLPWDC